jgi:y4mF family transcriptional regulator
LGYFTKKDNKELGFCSFYCYNSNIIVFWRALMTSNEIGKMILTYRKYSGLSQLALAKLAGVGKTAVFDLEKGKETIQLNTLLKVLDVLNIRMTFETPFIQKHEKSV